MTFAEAKIQEGLQRGREEGRQEGELLGKRAALLRQLSRKFTVTDATLDEIITADDRATVLGKLW